VTQLLSRVEERRIINIATSLSEYIKANLSQTIDRKAGLEDYRTNPYVLMASASLMDLSDPERFAAFLFNNKLYMGLETSFGKSIEAILVGEYPVSSKPGNKWEDAQEKIAESKELEGLSLEEKARRRTISVWREVDKSCIVGNRRYLVGIKSGPNTINDTQVEAMKSAIATHNESWIAQTKKNYPGVTEIDIVLGLTYGTDRTTNNKENQILVKLLEHGFEEEDRKNKPGVLIDKKTRSIRVYRKIGQEFWAFIGNPATPEAANFIYLEVLLALTKALANKAVAATLEDRINLKMAQLSENLSKLIFPRKTLPEWIREDFSENELFWLATAMTAFFDEGI
jgi:hypothetical protein